MEQEQEAGLPCLNLLAPGPEVMAGAYTAVSGDVLGIHYNPALASTLK